MTAARDGHVAVLLDNGLVLLAGGESGGWHVVASAELYDPATGRFRATGSMTEPRHLASATKLLSGKVLVVGGRGSTGASYDATAELYDPVSAIFTATGSMAHARDMQTATLLSDGRVLIAGGASPDGTEASAEIYDPATGVFRATGSLIRGRIGHTATLLSDGRVLVVGGGGDTCGSRGICASAEIFDPATGRFTSTGSMAHARRLHTATLLSDGRVLIAGGDFGGAVRGAELYDPATGRFVPSDDMESGARFGHTATVLADGRIIMVGGTNDTASMGPLSLATTMMFWSPTDGFKVGPSMSQARRLHTATLLPDGRVLVAGGESGGLDSVPLRSAQVYTP